jgi:hypothetical protein
MKRAFLSGGVMLAVGLMLAGGMVLLVIIAAGVFGAWLLDPQGINHD